MLLFRDVMENKSVGALCATTLTRLISYVSYNHICRAKPIQPSRHISLQESEIEAAAWIPWDQFLREAPFKGVAMYDRIAEQCVAWAEGRYSGLAGARLESGWVRRRQDLLLWGNAVGSSVGSMEASQDGDEAATAGAP